MQKDENIEKDNKWKFEDYAFLITGIIVVALLVIPEILEAQFGISILGGSLNDDVAGLVEDIGYGSGINRWSFNQLRALSPMLFLLTTTIVFVKDAIDARKSGGYKGSLFTHTFESLLEDSIYMAITTIFVYGAILFGAMYASWLAGPITWILFILIFPLVKRKNRAAEKTDIPWALLIIFVFGIIAEVITRAWVTFPLAWLVICIVKLVGFIREGNYSAATFFDILYYSFSVILLVLGILLDFWLVSWTSFPIALLICWIASKLGVFAKVEADK